MAMTDYLDFVEFLEKLLENQNISIVMDLQICHKPPNLRYQMKDFVLEILEGRNVTHGHRTPTDGPLYKDDPYAGLAFEPYGPGQLTNEGKSCSYRLGTYLRSKYIDFLGGYRSGTVDAITTICERTQASLQLFLAGIYPPEGELVWNKHLSWQPIPYVCEDITNDRILTTSFRNEDFSNRHWMYQQELGIPQKYKDFFSFLSQKMYIERNNLDYAWRLYIKLLTQQHFGLLLPEWTCKIYPKPLEDLALEYYQTQMMAPDLREIAIGRVVEKIIDDTNNKLANKSTVKLHVYSGHELNIAHLLLGLNSFTPPHMPDYNACIIVEVRKVEDDASVAVLYKARCGEDPKYLPLWGQNPCPFHQFVKLMQKKNFE